MKIHFKDLGEKKFTKTVEISGYTGFDDLLAFIEMECVAHLPKAGDFEIIPTDGLPPLVSNNYIVVHEDMSHINRQMGVVIVYQ